MRKDGETNREWIERASKEPTLGDAIAEVLERSKTLLEWIPPCSKGSSGYIRRESFEKALENLEAAWALARL
jgi:hypothetical protein